MHVHFVVHESFEAPGAFETWVRERGFTVQVVCDADQQGWWLAMGELSVAAPQTIAELATLMDRSALFVGNDSGPGRI